MVVTYKNKFNKKYGFPKDESHSIADIARITGYKKSGLETIFDKGVGSYYGNPSSVRATVKSPQHWAQARIFSAVMGGPASRVDAKHLQFV